MDGIFGDRTKSALTKLSTTKAEDLYPANRITNHNRELISRALDISSRITDTLYPSIPLGLVQRQLNEAAFRDVNGELLVEDGIFGEQMEGALRGYGKVDIIFSEQESPFFITIQNGLFLHAGGETSHNLCV